MVNEIRQNLLNIIIHSLSTDQVKYLGERYDGSFDMCKILNISQKIPIPRQTAAEVLLNHFSTEEEMLDLFNYLLAHDGKRVNTVKLNLWGKDKFISLLSRNKWVYDEEINIFLRDPFFEHEINLLNKIRVIDLRNDIKIDNIIKEITAASEKLSIKDLEWRVTLRLYDIEHRIGELIREIINLLLGRQKLQVFTAELYTCLKELAVNATKANYKKLFEKHVSSKDDITTKNNYHGFLIMFKEEINSHGNKRLVELARQDDQFINIIFQSTNDAIEIWVTNNSSISLVEKRQIMKKLKGSIFEDFSFENLDDDLAEGAGFGLNLILSLLKDLTSDKEPLKIVFFPDFIKIGFRLLRSEMTERAESTPAE